MICPQCGFDNKPGKKFCIECGAKFALKCPECGSEMRVIAVIQDLAEIKRILKHLKKIGRAPPGVDYSKLPD